MRDDGIASFICFMLLVFSAFTCGRGYSMGYESHREDVCTRTGGVWMEATVNGAKKHRCVHRGQR